jgi:molybdenum cofactor cytidylyltransferase
LLSPDDTSALQSAGYDAVVVARLEDGDLTEDEAAERIAAALQGGTIQAGRGSSGRINLFAAVNGLLVYDGVRLDDINHLDEAIALALRTLYDCVEAGELIATIKIVPYGLARTSVEKVLALLEAPGFLRIAAFRPTAVGLLQTELPGTRVSVLDKTRATCDARLTHLGSSISAEQRCAHHEKDIAAGLRDLIAQGCELILIAGASATADRRDVVPVGIERAGGRIIHLGMPVEPGNLILLGRLEDRPVLCMPGSARSLTRSGVDWILERLLAGLDVTGDDIMRMGAGGLLKRMTRSRDRADETRGAND